MEFKRGAAFLLGLFARVLTSTDVGFSRSLSQNSPTEVVFSKIDMGRLYLVGLGAALDPVTAQTCRGLRAIQSPIASILF